MSDRLRRHRDDLLARIMGELRRDDRVQAAWLDGSFGRGTADDWSDLDLHVVVHDDALVTWLDERGTLYHRLGHPVLTLPSSASEKGDYQGVLFDGPVFLDLAVHPVSTAERDPDTHLLFERAEVPAHVDAGLADEEKRTRLQHDVDFFWAMTPIAVKYIGRGHTHRAVTMVDLLSETFVRLWRLVHDPVRRDAGGAHWLHPERDADLVRLTPRLGAVIDRSSTLRAVTELMDEVRQLHPLLERLGVSLPVEAVRQVDQFRDAVARECR